MLEKPDLADALILDHLSAEYGLQGAEITFLPLGADVNTSVYRVDATEGRSYFLKLRSGSFDELQVLVPRLLQNQGVQAVIAPLLTRAGRLWGEIDGFKLVLYPFKPGQDGYQVEMSERQWVKFGAALKGIHATQLPSEIKLRIPRETFPARWRDMVRMFQERVKSRPSGDGVARKMAAFMRSGQGEITRIVERSEGLARILKSRPPEMVLCHADIHPGNLLIGQDDALFLVDWDTLAIAPKERDLMFAGMEGSRDRELFRQGYGQMDVNPYALAYYHYERIVEDLAAYGEQLLLSDEGGADREQSFRHFASIFEPDNALSRADQVYAQAHF